MIVQNKDLLQQMTEAGIQAGVLRELLSKGLTSQALKAVKTKLANIGTQESVLLNIRSRLENDQGA